MINTSTHASIIFQHQRLILLEHLSVEHEVVLECLIHLHLHAVEFLEGDSTRIRAKLVVKVDILDEFTGED